MKKTATLLTLVLFTFCSSFAQNANLIFFTENGERFDVILNGMKYTEAPQTNVKIEGVSAGPNKAKIVFEDKTWGTLDKTVYPEAFKETSIVIKKKDTKQGEKYVFRIMNIIDIPVSTPAPVVVNTPPPSSNASAASVTTTTTTTVVNAGTPVPADQVSINMNVGGMGGSVSMNIGASGMGMGTSSSTTVYEETTTTTVNTGSNVAVANTPPPNSGCNYPMDNGSFSSAQNSISSKSFEDTKLTMAKQICSSNCLSSAQVRDVAQLFDFEDTKLQFAKFAYDRTYDRNNYFEVNSVFDFESSIETLNNYIQAR